MKWGEYKICDLFTVQTVKSFDEWKLEISKNQKYWYIEFIGRTRTNNWVKWYINKLKIDPNDADVISISQIGTVVAQLRREKRYASQNIFSLTPLENQNKLLSLFIVSAINKSLMWSYSDWYSNYPTLDTLKDLTIHLPTKNWQIDFDFIEVFVAELEAERVAELEAYLTTTWLKDYDLTDEEKQVLEDFESGKFEWGEFSYKKIFNKIIQGRRLKKNDQISGDIPFVMAGTTNTGVVNYISNPIASFPQNSITIDIFGNTFYRNYAFWAGDDTGVYWNDEKEYSKSLMLYFATSMWKSLAWKFDFWKKLRSSQSFNFTMRLPIQNNQPNYEIMNTFISAIQKLVIRDVVDYADHKIQATKEIITK